MRDSPPAVLPTTAPRGRPLVATLGRWAVTSAALGLATVAALAGALGVVHSSVKIGAFSGTLAAAIGVEMLLLAFFLRAEEARLARELRTARTGTAVLRAMVASRRPALPFFARLFSTNIGLAAVLLGDGDWGGALSTLASESRAMQGGRLGLLRTVVECDAQRARGTPDSLRECIAGIRGLPTIGNREADLYALHVVVKALLQWGAPEDTFALDVVARLERSTDEEERLYLVWLRAWFELDEADGATHPSADGHADTERPRPTTDGELRLAALLARAQGADRLVEKLEARLQDRSPPLRS